MAAPVDDETIVLSSIKEELVTETTIFPNPADAEINLNTPSSTSPRKIFLVNLQGVTLHKSELAPASTSTRIPLGPMADGIYLLVVESNEKVERHKVFIQQKR
jgi:hypothetical protein